MAEPEDDFIQHAGTVYFPRGTTDLTSTTQCPACFAPLSSRVCSVCSLDLNHPSAGELASTSTDVAALLNRRVSIIGRMRFETAQLLAKRNAPAEATAAPAAQQAAPAQEQAQAASVPWASPTAASAAPSTTTTAPAQPATAASAPPAGTGPGQPAAPAQPAAPRRSSVQLILLIVGISLLSLAAIFFLVYAFINFGLIWRSVIIGAITIAAFTVASLLKRKNLGATAEGIAVFAVVLVYLDAFALRENDFFGLLSADGQVYWGLVFVLSSVGFLVWNRASGLRTASVAAFTALAPGVGLLVSGLSTNLDTALQSYLAATAMTLVAIAHPLATGKLGTPRRLTEKVILLSIAALASLAAVVFGTFVGPEFDWAPALAFAALAVVAGLHVFVLTRPWGAEPGLKAFSWIFAGIAGATAASAIGQAAWRINQEAFTVIAPVVAAAIVALALEFFVSRQAADSALRTPLTVSAWAAAGVGALLVLFPGVIAFGLVLFAVLQERWSIGGAQLVTATQDYHYFAVLALALVAAIAAAFWGASGRLARRRTALTWAVAVVAVVAVPLVAVQWGITAGWLLLGAASIAALIAARRKATLTGPLRAALITVAAIATALGYLASWSSLDTWLPATLAAIAILVAARWAVRGKQADAPENVLGGPGGPAALLGGATALAFIGAGALALHIDFTTITTLEFRPNDLSDRIDVARFVGILGAVLVAVSAVPLKAVSALDRRVVFWISAVVTAVAAASSWFWLGIHEPFDRLLLPEFATSLVLSVATFAAVLLWVVLRANAALRPERIAASILVGPTVYWVVDSFVRVLGLPEFAESVAPATSALIVAAGALTITVLRPSTTPRWAREIGIAIVAVPAVVGALYLGSDSLWLTLLLAGVTALFLAISKDGLFGSESLRKHYGWLALALATAGLWVRLGDDEVTALEPYVLPLAGALLLVALLVWRSANRSADGEPNKSAPFIALGGLLVAILPLSANAITGTDVRAIVLFAVSSALLLLGSTVVGSSALRPYLDVAALSGAVGVLVTGIGRATELHPNGPGLSDPRFDAWLGATFLVLFIAAFGQARDRADAAARLRLVASQALGALALTAVLVLGVSALGTGEFADVRALALVLLFAAVHVIAFLVNRAPLTRMIGWLAIAYSAVAVIAGIAFDRLEPLEVGTVPLALALLTSGSVHLARTPAARSWPFLGPGVAVLLLPSLLATFFDDKPLWRLVGLGVLAVTVLVVGLVRKLQAPFLLGAIVAVVHGIATFAPQIRAVYESAPWWLWAGIGGVLLILLAARYENRIKNLKSVVMRVSSLR